MTTSEEKQKEKEQGQIREQTIQEIVGSSEIKNHYKIPYRGRISSLSNSFRRSNIQQI